MRNRLAEYGELVLCCLVALFLVAVLLKVRGQADQIFTWNSWNIWG